LLRTKDEALDYFKIYVAKVENQLERKIKRLRSDHGGEYFPNFFDEFCEEHGIIHERTPPYSPQSNGVAESKNHMLSDLAIPFSTLLVYRRHGGGGFVDYMPCPK
jgi:transposase InsO family protein